MKSSICFAAIGLAAYTSLVFAAQVLVAGPPSQPQPDNGNRSWSRSYSHNWGDAPAAMPNYLGPAPMAPIYVPPMHVPPMYGFGMGPNSGPPNGSWGSSVSSASHSMSINGGSVMHALASLQFSTGIQIRLTEKAGSLIDQSKRTVTLSEVNQAPSVLAEKILSGTSCQVSLIDNQLVVSAEGEQVDSSKLAEQTTSLASRLLQSALKQPVNLTMHHTPVPFVIQMLQGMTGVTIQVPAENRSFFYTPQPSVSVTANQTPLSEVLDSIAKQIKATVVVHDAFVELQSLTPYSH